MSITTPLSPSQPGRARRAPWRTATGLAHQPSLDVDLLLSTHLSIVVHARVEFDEAGRAHETGLVIARERCDGDRPSGQALLEAAHRCVGHLSYGAAHTPRAARRVLARVDGHWLPLLDRSGGGSGDGS